MEYFAGRYNKNIIRANSNGKDENGRYHGFIWRVQKEERLCDICFEKTSPTVEIFNSSEGWGTTFICYDCIETFSYLLFGWRIGGISGDGKQHVCPYAISSGVCAYLDDFNKCPYLSCPKGLDEKDIHTFVSD